MSAELGVPVEVLERTRDVSSGALATPEYWLDWYAEALEASAGAKRANRDFREGGEPEGGVPGAGGAISIVAKKEAVPEKADDEVEPVDLSEEQARAVEREVVQNVCIEPDEIDLPVARDEEDRGSIAFTWRSVVRRRVYDMLKADEGCVKRSRDGEQAAQEGDGVDAEKTPERDKIEPKPLDREALRAFLVEAGGQLGEPFLARTCVGACRCYERESPAVLKKLRFRRRKPPERVDSVKVSKVPRRKKPPWLPVAAIDTGMSVPDGPRMTTSTGNEGGTSVEVGEPPEVGTRGDRHSSASFEVEEPAAEVNRSAQDGPGMDENVCVGVLVGTECPLQEEEDDEGMLHWPDLATVDYSCVVVPDGTGTATSTGDDVRAFIEVGEQEAEASKTTTSTVGDVAFGVYLVVALLISLTIFVPRVLHDLLDGVFRGGKSAMSVLLAWNGWCGLVDRGVNVAAVILVLSCYRRLRRLHGVGPDMMPNQVADQGWNELKAPGEGSW